ncbi:hypothetical protein Esti_001021 [Eimeria stiedai]
MRRRSRRDTAAHHTQAQKARRAEADLPAKAPETSQRGLSHDLEEYQGPFLTKKRLLWPFAPSKLTGWREGKKLELPQKAGNRDAREAHDGKKRRDKRSTPHILAQDATGRSKRIDETFPKEPRANLEAQCWKFDALVAQWSGTTARVFLNMLREYSDVSPDSLPPELPVRRCVDHTIPTIPNALPPNGPTDKLDRRAKLSMKEETTKLADRGLSTHTSSPYAVPCMLVSKEAGRPGEPKK